MTINEVSMIKVRELSRNLSKEDRHTPHLQSGVKRLDDRWTKAQATLEDRQKQLTAALESGPPKQFLSTMDAVLLKIKSMESQLGAEFLISDTTSLEEQLQKYKVWRRFMIHFCLKEKCHLKWLSSEVYIEFSIKSLNSLISFLSTELKMLSANLRYVGVITRAESWSRGVTVMQTREKKDTEAKQGTLNSWPVFLPCNKTQLTLWIAREPEKSYLSS